MATAKKKSGKNAKKAEPIRLTFDTDAHALMDEHCTASPRNEVCGVLVGFTGTDGHGRWTRVVAVIEGRHAREDQMSVTFTHETWDVIHAQLARRNDKARVVGWYHTHPDFGIFYSAPDVFVHRNFFGLDGQIGVVIDPVRGERGVFANAGGGIQTLGRYEVARMNKLGHLVKCSYALDALRETRMEARAAADDGDRSATGQGGEVIADARSRTQFSQSSLDSIEASLAQLQRQAGINFKLALFGLFLTMLTAFAVGILVGRDIGLIGSPRREIYLDVSPRLNNAIPSVHTTDHTQQNLKSDPARTQPGANP